MPSAVVYLAFGSLRGLGKIPDVTDPNIALYELSLRQVLLGESRLLPWNGPTWSNCLDLLWQG